MRSLSLAVLVGGVVLWSCSQRPRHEVDADSAVDVGDDTEDGDTDTSDLDEVDLADTADTADTADSDSADVPTDGDGETSDPRCDGPVSTAGSRLFDDPLGQAVVVVEEASACLKTYRLSSTAVRRDDLPASPRVVVERVAAPRLRTGHDLFDAVYALALDEVRENSVAQITDQSFNGGQPLPCPEGGCFETGRKWPWVWTRDTAYAVHLGLAAIDPVRARNSLIFKTSERRAGGDRQVVQDTGSGGAWPVSTDRVVWALGARAVLNEIEGAEREAFVDLVIETLRNTIELDRKVVFDSKSGLYFGEQSFLDWREQSYPLWTRSDVIDIATSRSLSTNVLHLEALRLLVDLLEERGQDTSRYRAFEAALTEAMGAFWREDLGVWGSFLPTPWDDVPVGRLDLLGTSLATLAGLAPERAAATLSKHAAYGPGLPVMWPQQQLVAIYHNRASWPFVSAYALLAARRLDGINGVPADGTFDHLVNGLWHAAALNLSHMENLEAETGAPWREDSGFSGPVVNSQRQLWSVAGHLAMVHRGIFGIEPTREGLRVEPWLTGGLRDGLFGATDRLVLVDYPFRGRAVTVVLHLPPVGSGTRYRAQVRRLDGGVEEAADGVIAAERLGLHSVVEVEMVAETAATRPVTQANPSNWREVFSPRTPLIQRIEVEEERLRLMLWNNEDDKNGLTVSVWRDGVKVADGLSGTTTSWTDPESLALAERSPCYVVEARFSGTVGENRSQRSRAVCWWGASFERVRTFGASTFVAVGGTLVEQYGRVHYEGWGDAGHSLEVRDIEVEAGSYLVQVGYGNGAGPINTGIACGTKRVRVVRQNDGAVMGEGVLVMPQLGRWDVWGLSSVVAVELPAGRYEVVISADEVATNMSDRVAFATYRASGTLGGEAPFNRVNISELRLLRR